jgi:hypothetical protein
MMRTLFLLALALLTACAPLPDAEVVMEAPAVAAPACGPGDNDGIGGTGCQLD